jgi:hypothetical protein
LIFALCALCPMLYACGALRLVFQWPNTTDRLCQLYEIKPFCDAPPFLILLWKKW